MSTGYSSLFTSGLESSRPRQSLSPARSYLSLSGSDSSRSLARTLPSPKPVPSMPLPPSPSAPRANIASSSVRTPTQHLASARADALASLEGRTSHPRTHSRPARRSFMSMSDDEDEDVKPSRTKPTTTTTTTSPSKPKPTPRLRANTVVPPLSSTPSPRKERRSSLFASLQQLSASSVFGTKRRGRGASATVNDAGLWLVNFLELDTEPRHSGIFSAARAA